MACDASITGFLGVERGETVTNWPAFSASRRCAKREGNSACADDAIAPSRMESVCR